MRVVAFVVAMKVCGAAPSDLGGRCKANDDCEQGLTCNTTVPDGYCTSPCMTTGSTTECPAEAVCDSLVGTAKTCLKICETTPECDGDQVCTAVATTKLMACKPKP